MGLGQPVCVCEGTLQPGERLAPRLISLISGRGNQLSNDSVQTPAGKDILLMDSEIICWPFAAVSGYLSDTPQTARSDHR